MTKIKICGLRRDEDIAYVNECMPEYVGFVFAKSPRQVTAEAVREFRRKLHPDIKVTGVFVNEEVGKVGQLCQQGVIDVAQLHGDEDQAYITYLKELTDKAVIKAVRVQSREQVEEAQTLSCDFLLLDTYQKNTYGGSGHVFDLSLVPKLEKPFFLAGGLTPDNVKMRIQSIHPYGVDISSGVEDAAGWKDLGKIKRFVDEARGE